MSDDDRQRGSNAYAQNLTEAIDDMHQARRIYRQVKSERGGCPQHIHQLFEQAVLEAYDEMLPFTIENEEIAQLWEEADLDTLPDRCARVHTESTPNTSGGRATVDHEEHMISCPIPVLIRVSHTFDMMATKLGFNVDTSKSRKRGVIGDVE